MLIQCATILYQVSCEGVFEVVDFSSLTLQPVVDPVDVNASFSIQHHQLVSIIFQHSDQSHLSQFSINRSVTSASSTGQ